jgi:hypothetical protein
VQASDLSAELAWLQTQPETIARDQNIVSLMNSINQLKQATDSNTAATAATLNPLYSQGHGALAIGYYKAATGLDGLVQGPSGVDQVPVHMMLTAGERVQVTPQGQSQNSNDNSRSSHTTIVQSFDFRGAQSNSRRSSRQYAQGFGQTAAAMS